MGRIAERARPKIVERPCKTALSKTGVSSYDYTVNPYTGCLHGCVYCLDGDTPILMADGTGKPIRALKVGDEVIGTVRMPNRRINSRIYVKTVVQDQWKITKPAVEISLSNGTRVVCSEDHRWLTERGWKYALRSSYEKSQRPYLTPNNLIRGFGRLLKTPPTSKEYRRGYLAAIIRGDGLLRTYDYSGRRQRRIDVQHQFRLAMNDKAALQRTYEYLLELGVQTNWFKFKMGPRGYVDAIRTNRRELCDHIRTLTRFESDPEWLRGWLAGIFDAEGSGRSKATTGIIRIVNKDKGILRTTTRALRYYKFECEREHYAKRIPAIRVKGGTPEYMRFFALINTAIPRKMALEGKAVKGRTRVACVTRLEGEREMYDITTGTSNFIANGLVSHNCYANFMRRFSGHLRDAWGSFVDVKVNLLDVLAKELPRRSGGRVWLSSVCDPYQQVEAKYRLTRGAIGLLSRYRKFSISILTKNTLVLRDIDLLVPMKDRVDVGFTITTFSHAAQPFFEPHSSLVKDRIDALRRLNEVGIDTWVFIAPMLPYVTEVELEDGLRQLAEAGVKRLLTDRYNARGMIINQTLKAYESWKPSANPEEIRQLLWKGDKYYHELDERVSRLWRKAAINAIHEKVF